MYAGKTVFTQLMDCLPWSTFARLVARYRGDFSVQTLPCAEQYRAMAFAQLTYRESLRDIEACLSAQPGKLYHMGFHGPVRRSTLADANQTRDWRIYAEFAQRLIAQARRLYVGESLSVDLKESVYALDSTTIDLCLSLFPWAHFRSTKAAVKMHTLLDLRGNIPSFIHISDGKLHDVHALDMLVPEAGAIYVMDRGYVDFGRLYPTAPVRCVFRDPGQIQPRCSSGVFNRHRSHDRRDRRSDDHAGRVLHEPGLSGASQAGHASGILKTAKTLVFLTNQTALPALTICDLYKSRWQVELFFKWIKQHLRIKQFYGISENAVKTQIWIAVSVYVLAAIVRKRLKLEVSLYTLMQVFSVTVFEKASIESIISQTADSSESVMDDNQLNLFGY